MKTRIGALFIFFCILSANAEPLSVNLGKIKIRIEVKDPETLKGISQVLIPKGGPTNAVTLSLLGTEEENAQYLKELESADIQTLRESFVTYIKDIIDFKAEKAPAAEDAKFSDLPIDIQKELTAFAMLREQIGLNWLEAEIAKRKLKNPSPKELAKILGTEISLLINDETVEAHFKKK